jgi:hypothetical protein
MAHKKMLFPLEMCNGVKVYVLQELKDNFDIVKAVEYADDGRLQKWLCDRGNNDMTEKINGLDKMAKDYPKDIYTAIFGEAPNEELTGRLEADLERKEQRKKEFERQREIELENAEAEKQYEEEARKKVTVKVKPAEGESRDKNIESANGMPDKSIMLIPDFLKHHKNNAIG